MSAPSARDGKMSEKIDLAEWKRVAEAALAQAYNDPTDWYDAEFLFDDCFRNRKNAAFVAEVSPAQVLALIEALEVARQTLMLRIVSDSTKDLALTRIAELLGEE